MKMIASNLSSAVINLINVKVDSAFFASLVSASSRFLLPAVMKIKKICHHSARKKKFNLSLVFKKMGFGVKVTPFYKFNC